MAISYSKDSKVIANDLYTLLHNRGINTYYCDNEITQMIGNASSEIERIYKNSQVNCMIYSTEYKSKQKKTMVYHEKNTIYQRHIKGKDTSSLVIILNDMNLNKLVLEQRFENLIYYSNKEIGLMKILDIIIAMLIINKNEVSDETGKTIYHPAEQIAERGTLELCSFFIKPDYNRDQQWHKQGDVVVTLKNNHEEKSKGKKIFLIPSGAVNPLIRHTNSLLDHEKALLLIKAFY